MSLQKPWLIVRIIAVVLLFLAIFSLTLGGMVNNPWYRTALIIFGICVALLNLWLSLNELRTTEGERRTASAIRLGVAIIFALSMVLDGARLLHYNLPVPDIPYTIVCWLFLITINLANNTWGKAEWRQLRQFLISVIIVVGGIFAWVSLMR